MVKLYQFQTLDARQRHTDYVTQREFQRKLRLDAVFKQRSDEIKLQTEEQTARKLQLDQVSSVRTQIEEQRARRLELSRRIPEEARPTPETTAARRGLVSPDPALGRVREPGIPSLVEDVFRQVGRVAGGPGLEEAFLPENVGGLAPRIPTSLISEENRNRARFQELLEETRQSFPSGTPPGTTHESIALDRLEKELQDERAARITEARVSRTPLPPGGAIAPIPTDRPGLLAQGLEALEATPAGGPFFRQPGTGKTAFEEGAEISRPVVRAVQPIVAEPFEQVEAAGIPVVSPAAGGVATAIESKIVEDIATEVINPAALVLVAPIVMQGTQGLRGAALAAQMSSNLLATGLEPALVRGTLRGLTAIGARGAAAARTLPQAVRETPIIQQALRGIREAPAAGGGRLAGMGNLDEFGLIRAYKSTDDLTLRDEIAREIQRRASNRFTHPEEARTLRKFMESAEFKPGATRPVEPPPLRDAEPSIPQPLGDETPPTPPLRGGGALDDLARQAQDFDIHTAKADPGPPPKGPPQEPPAPKRPSPDDPEFDDILDAAIKGELPDQALMRRHQGVIDARASQLAVEVTDNNKELVRIGLGQDFRGSVVAKTEGSFDELNSLLHNPGAVARGERVVPDELRPIYDKLRAQTDWEQAARIDFDPNQALVEDYFFRGWKPPEGLFTGVQRGSLGRNPAFKLPRVDATYDEMFEAGFRPMFENPAEQARHSQLMGIKYREQSRLIVKMQASEIAQPVKGGPIPEGWRVPEVGPAFQGKPYANGADVAYTRQWAVPDSMANRLENIYGKMPRLGKGEILGKTVDFQKMVDFLTFVPKRAKLVGSVFQHLDFLSRSGFGAWTGFVDAIRRGDPAAGVVHLAKWPKSAVEIVHSTFSPGARARLAKLGVDPKPLWKDRQISNLMLREEGLSLRDPTLGIDLDDVIRQVKQEPRIVKLGKAPIRALDALERQWRQGLFQGTYPAAILSDVKNNIGPMVIRQHPEATDRQLAGMIAKATNKLYSVVPESQSVIQNKQARWFLTRFLFSLGENEGLLRSFTGAIKGENAALFRTRLLGTYLGLMMLASTIHFASTGKPLPLDRFSPVSKDKFGPLPFGYNTDFAAPTLPIKGRGDVEVTLDLVMQQDTIFRILDPKSFLNARFSVPVSTLRNQITGTDFFGAPIDKVGPGGIFSRTSQLVQDMFAPIGAGQAGLEIFRNNVEESEGLITPGEGRLGTAGLGIQAGGVNLRAERTPELVDRTRGEVLRDRGIEETYEVIASTDLPLKAEIDDEVEERIGAELEIRGETVKIRGQQTPQSEGFEALEATRERQQVEQLADDTKLNSNQWSGDVWREKYADRQRQFFASKEQIKEDFQITFDDRKAPPKSVNAAIDAYFDVNVDDYAQRDGTIDWDRFFDARDDALKPLSASDKKRVVGWLRKFDTPTVTEFRKAKDVVDEVFETPKYIGLSLEEGEEVDRILFEIVPKMQTAQLRQGVELERGQAVMAAISFVQDPDVARFLLTNFGPRLSVRRRRRRGRTVTLAAPNVVNPERDEILIENQDLLALFYPDLLARQLSREQEAGLGEQAFAAVQR
jgi:hypothetical protein